MSNYCAANYLKGSMGRDIIRSLLERSGYTVCAYGYEETLLDAKSKYTYKKYNSMTGHRLTHSPDLLVYDDKDVMMLVEVKTRGKTKRVQAGEVWIDSHELNPLRDFWSDSILALVVEEEDVFYAERMNEFEVQKSDRYPLTTFKKFQEIFTRVNPEAIAYHKNVALQMFKIFGSERDEIVYSPERWKGKGEGDTTDILGENQRGAKESNLNEPAANDETAERKDLSLCKNCHSQLIVTPDGTKCCSKCGLVVGKGYSWIGRQPAGNDAWDGSKDNSERVVEGEHW